jgi:magnesium-protoporphyrin O-methyltransferase
MQGMDRTYTTRRGEIETYFDRTAAVAWSRLTSDAPVSGIRATVRAGRDRMRATLLSFLPQDLTGLRILDAGCGTGALAIEAARRGAEVVAIDLSPTLVELAKERMPQELSHALTFLAGDMLDPRLGLFDHVIGMDSLIHYEMPDMIAMLARLSAVSRRGVHFTFAPYTMALGAMHQFGKLFPRGDRSPAIVPHRAERLRAAIGADARFQGWSIGRDQRIASGFYISHAQELVHA